MVLGGVNLQTSQERTLGHLLLVQCWIHVVHVGLVSAEQVHHSDRVYAAWLSVVGQTSGALSPSPGYGPVAAGL